MSAPPSARVTARRDGSMSLLVDLMGDTSDHSYAAAARRRQGARAGCTTRTRRSALPLLVLVGLVTGTAAAQVRARAAVVDGGRGALLDEVHRRTAESDALDRQVQELRASFAAAQASGLGATSAGQQAAGRLAGLELQAGTVPVRGPGLVVTLDDAPQAGDRAVARGGQAGQGRVLDRDLQEAVNGLWAAGAEAVSVNDLRLTALTAIRSAGEAVLVDFRPLRPPYVLRAVGPSGELERRFREGASGRRLATYPGRYGLRVDVSRSAGLQLPAAGVPELRSVGTR